MSTLEWLGLRGAPPSRGFRVVKITGDVMLLAGGAGLPGTVGPLLAAGAPPTLTVQKPRALTVSGGICRVKDDGTLGANIGLNAAMPTLALTIGPGVSWPTKFTGSGKRDNELMALQLGKTALEDSYMGLGTVTIAADGKSGTFAMNDGKASGSFNCGAAPTK